MVSLYSSSVHHYLALLGVRAQSNEKRINGGSTKPRVPTPNQAHLLDDNHLLYTCGTLPHIKCIFMCHIRQKIISINGLQHSSHLVGFRIVEHHMVCSEC